MDTDEPRKLVAAAVVVESGKILIAKRRADGNSPNLWEFPGGKIESGETAESCLEREFEEEFLMEIKVGSFLERSNIQTGKNATKLLAYWATPISQPKELNAHSELAWVSPDELLDYELAPADIPIAHSITRQGLPKPSI